MITTSDFCSLCYICVQIVAYATLEARPNGSISRFHREANQPVSNAALGVQSRICSDHATELAEDYAEAIADATSLKGIYRAVDLAGAIHC